MERAKVTMVCAVVIVSWLVFVGNATSGVPEGTPVLEASTLMAAPGWALKERELLDLNSRAAELFGKAYVLPNGWINVRYEHGGGVRAPDDMLECIYKFPLLYALGADEACWGVWWKVWLGSISQCTSQDLFVNEMAKYLDWHHNGEHYQGFWLAALCAPQDPEYRRLALKFAGFYDGTNPDVPNYDPERKVMRSMLTGGAGPVLNPTEEDWGKGGGAFWTPWLDCVHDSPVNMVTTCFGTNAFMLTGDERYRRVTLGYINAWRDRARANGGVIPSIVRPDGKVPPEWWGGVMGWNFTASAFGGMFQVTSGPRAGWGNALLLTGNASYYDSLRTVADAMWKHRFTNREGKLDLPSEYGPNGWYGTQWGHSGGRRTGVYASILANIYLATMKQEDLDRILERRMIQGACGHGGSEPMNYWEGGYEPEWISYLVGKNARWPEQALDYGIVRVKRQIAALEKEAKDGPEKRREPSSGPAWHAGYCGPLVNLMTGGIMPLWHGQLHLARFRYFDPERERPGIPLDCAARVESMTDDSATLALVNVSRDTAHTVLVQTGAYAEHQCLSVQPDGGAEVKVNGMLFAVHLAPGAGQRFTVRMKRYANVPTLHWPWQDRKPKAPR